MLGNILIIFDFWGASNMGDDLMVDGFLRGLQQLQPAGLGSITCLCGCDIASQRRRFPEITWIETKDESAFQLALDGAKTVIGFGGTPFQLTSGDWLLRHIVGVFSRIKPETKVVFINVGAETEIFPRADEFAGILRRINHCSARDDFSHRILAGLKVKDAAEIHVGGDLANLSLPNLVKSVTAENTKTKYLLGVVLGFDTLSHQDLMAVNKFLKGRLFKPRTAFITGDSRDEFGFEYHLHKSWTRHWFSILKRKLSLERPDYAVCSMEDLVRPFAQCETIISSRYHGLLAAAWFGCKVAAIGRSSKVTALARALGVPVIVPPIKRGDLKALEKAAVRVAPERLEEFRQAALAGISTCVAFKSES
jgi:polysaccharide pyruvyl transferase WcaK-like protein